MGAIAGQSNNIVDKSAFIPLPQRGLAPVDAVPQTAEQRRAAALRDHLRVDGAGEGDERKARRRRKDELTTATINRFLQFIHHLY